MGDNSIFIVFSNIWSSVCLKITPQFQDSWQHRLFTLDMCSFFSIYLVFLYLNAANKRVLLLYACAHKISLKYLFPRDVIGRGEDQSPEKTILMPGVQGVPRPLVGDPGAKPRKLLDF